MTPELLNNFIFHDISSDIISQLIKLEEIGVLIEEVIEKEELDMDFFKEIQVSDLRILKSLLNDDKFTKTNKTTLFSYYCQGIEIIDVLQKELNAEKTMFLANCLEYSFNNKDHIDIKPIEENINCSLKFLKQIFNDLKKGIDVNKYINSTLSTQKKELLRYSLSKGVDINEDLEQFKFIKTKEEIDVLLELKKYDYKKVLKKFKDIEKAKIICEAFENEKIDLKDFSNKLSKKSLLTLIDKAREKKDITPFKKFTYIASNEFDLYEEMLKYDIDINKYKDKSEETLQCIVEALENNEEGIYGKIDIDKCLNFYFTKLPVLFAMDCYKYNQNNLIDELEPLLKQYEFLDVIKDVQPLLKYNYENENKINLTYFLYNEKGEMENPYLIKSLSKELLEENIDMDFVDKIKPCKYNSQEINIVLNAYKQGYDIDIMLDKNLTASQLSAILTCYQLGLNITKEKEYELETKKPQKEKTNSIDLVYKVCGDWISWGRDDYDAF